MAQRSAQVLIGLLQSKPVVGFDEIQTALGGASRSTSFRYLEQVPYRSSYNHNGRYYALHDQSRYDRWGLFSVGDVHFSVDGTLKATVVRLVRDSDAGWTQKELQELLRVRVQLFLTAALREGAIDRECLGRLYVYLHTEPQVREAQLSARHDRLSRSTREAVVVDNEITIRVLLALLRYPGSQPGDVVRRLKGRSPPVSRSQIEIVFTQYGLGEKGGPRIY